MKKNDFLKKQKGQLDSRVVAHLALNIGELQHPLSKTLRRGQNQDRKHNRRLIICKLVPFKKIVVKSRKFN